MEGPMSSQGKCVAGLVIMVMSLGPCIGVPIDAVSAEINVSIPAPLIDNSKAVGPLQTAVLAGGCFWGVQGVFEHMRGVTKVLSGYSGGEKATAQYATV